MKRLPLWVRIIAWIIAIPVGLFALLVVVAFVNGMMHPSNDAASTSTNGKTTTISSSTPEKTVTGADGSTSTTSSSSSTTTSDGTTDAVSSDSGSSDSSAQSTSEQPAQSKALSEADELNGVDDFASPPKVVGNPAKYVGKVVRDDCQITNVVSAGDGYDANATCQVNLTPEEYGKYFKGQVASPPDLSAAQVVLIGPLVKDFDADQKITILGVVQPASEGKNNMGVDSSFATIRVDYTAPLN